MAHEQSLSATNKYACPHSRLCGVQRGGDLAGGLQLGAHAHRTLHHAAALARVPAGAAVAGQCAQRPAVEQAGGAPARWRRVRSHRMAGAARWGAASLGGQAVGDEALGAGAQRGDSCSEHGGGAGSSGGGGHTQAAGWRQLLVRGPPAARHRDVAGLSAGNHSLKLKSLRPCSVIKNGNLSHCLWLFTANSSCPSPLYSWNAFPGSSGRMPRGQVTAPRAQPTIARARTAAMARMVAEVVGECGM